MCLFEWVLIKCIYEEKTDSEILLSFIFDVKRGYVEWVWSFLIIQAMVVDVIAYDTVVVVEQSSHMDQ